MPNRMDEIHDATAKRIDASGLLDKDPYTLTMEELEYVTLRKMGAIQTNEEMEAEQREHWLGAEAHAANPLTKMSAEELESALRDYARTEDQRGQDRIGFDAANRFIEQTPGYVANPHNAELMKLKLDAKGLTPTVGNMTKVWGELVQSGHAKVDEAAVAEFNKELQREVRRERIVKAARRIVGERGGERRIYGTRAPEAQPVDPSSLSLEEMERRYINGEDGE